MSICVHLTFVRERGHEYVYMCVPLARSLTQDTCVTCCRCNHDDESGARGGGGLQPDAAARPLDRTRGMRNVSRGESLWHSSLFASL